MKLCKGKQIKANEGHKKGENELGRPHSKKNNPRKEDIVYGQLNVRKES